MHDLQDNFDEEIRITKECFREEDLHRIIDYIKTHSKSILGPNKKHQATAVEAFEEDFDHIQTIQELFSVLQKKYISWFNYELIVKLVRVFLSNDHSLKRRWSSYEEQLKDYFINSGGLLKDVDAVQFGITDVPPGTRVMIAIELIVMTTHWMTSSSFIEQYQMNWMFQKLKFIFVKFNLAVFIWSTSFLIIFTLYCFL